MVIMKNIIFTILGHRRPNYTFNEFYRFDIYNNQWYKLSIKGNFIKFNLL